MQYSIAAFVNTLKTVGSVAQEVKYHTPCRGKNIKQGAYISAMLSGRLAGMAVRPFPLQSTMLLLQVHMAGQEPPPMLHGCRPGDSW